MLSAVMRDLGIGGTGGVGSGRGAVSIIGVLGPGGGRVRIGLDRMAVVRVGVDDTRRRYRQRCNDGHDQANASPVYLVLPIALPCMEALHQSPCATPGPAPGDANGLTSSPMPRGRY